MSEWVSKEWVVEPLPLTPQFSHLTLRVRTFITTTLRELDSWVSVEVDTDASSNQALVETSTLCYVCLACNHSLAHASDIGSTHILWAIHLAVCCHTFPWIRSIALGLYLFMIHGLSFFICLLAEFDLLLSLVGPLEDLFAALCLPGLLLLLFMLLLLKECTFEFFLLIEHLQYALTLLIVKVLFLFNACTWWVPEGSRGETGLLESPVSAATWGRHSARWLESIGSTTGETETTQASHG